MMTETQETIHPLRQRMIEEALSRETGLERHNHLP